MERHHQTLLFFFYVSFLCFKNTIILPKPLNQNSTRTLPQTPSTSVLVSTAFDVKCFCETQGKWWNNTPVFLLKARQLGRGQATGQVNLIVVYRTGTAELLWFPDGCQAQGEGRRWQDQAKRKSWDEEEVEPRSCWLLLLPPKGDWEDGKIAAMNGKDTGMNKVLVLSINLHSRTADHFCRSIWVFSVQLQLVFPCTWHHWWGSACTRCSYNLLISPLCPLDANHQFWRPLLFQGSSQEQWGISTLPWPLQNTTDTGMRCWLTHPCPLRCQSTIQVSFRCLN